jgi:hypothetical protein
MKRDDVIRMARESGWAQKDIDSLLYIVETAAAAEREACAKLADSMRDKTSRYADYLGDVGEAIRSRT